MIHDNYVALAASPLRAGKGVRPAGGGRLPRPPPVPYAPGPRRRHQITANTSRGSQKKAVTAIQPSATPT